MEVREVENKKINLKHLARKRKRKQLRHSEVSLEIKGEDLDEPVIWSERLPKPIHLYPTIYAEKKKRARKPTAQELEDAKKVIHSFRSFDHGTVIVLDKSDRCSVVAIIEFTPLQKLSDSEKKEINFVTTYLHQSKKFVNKVGPSRTWGGGMWATGWQKCMKTSELFGRYVKQSAIRSFPKEYYILTMKSNKVSSILGQMFRSLARIRFESNQEVMKQNNIPSFSSLEFGDKLTSFDCSPHITFTSDQFYNYPHIDKSDVSSFSFLLVVPTERSNGKLVEDSNEYNVTGGEFVFPDLGFTINFKQKGIVKMVWAACKYRHCTFPAQESDKHTRMAMSLQINGRTRNTSRDLRSGLIYLRKTNKSKKDLYIGGFKNSVKISRKHKQK